MDTNVKKFRYTKSGKALCVLFSFVMAVVSIFLIFAGALSYGYCEYGNGKNDFTETTAFRTKTVTAMQWAPDNDFSYYQTVNGIKVYVVTQDKLTKEQQNIVNSVKSDDMYFIYKDGRYQTKNISKDTASDIVNSYIEELGFFEDDTSAANSIKAIYVSYNLEKQATSNIFSFFENYNQLAGLYKFHSFANEMYINLNTVIILAAVLLIGSFVLAFIYLPVAGKASGDSKAKLAFIDYVPIEIHLLITGLLVFGAGCLIVAENEDFFDFTMEAIYITTLLSAVIWLLVFEFCSSIARLVNAERKFCKAFLTYHIVNGIVFLTKKSLKLDKKIITKIKDKKPSDSAIKRFLKTLQYRPKQFKKNAVKIATLYAVCNVLALAILSLICVFVVDNIVYGPGGFESLLLLLLLAFTDLGVNIYFFNKVLKYIQQLDTIIDCTINRQDIDIDKDTLPQSLKMLTEGLEYTNAELNAAVARAVKDERLKTELITNVSHDLKTPLTSIITYIDLLSKCDIQDEKAQEYIKVLDDKGAKLKRLIDDLIEASKVTSGNITVNPTGLNLYELCLQATVDAQADFEKAGLELIVKNNGCDTIYADGAKTFRVLENLLSNAKKYSAKGSRVYVNVYDEDGMGVFEIKNISAQPLDISPQELTERFVRGDKSRNQEGNGLGLSIAKELCRVQNGTLEITIDGDLFKARVKLPLNKQAR